MENMTDISENVKYYRYLSDFTQEKLSEDSGIALITIKKLESGSLGVRPKTIKAIAGALKVSEADLLKPAKRLRTIRFRACRNMRSKESIVSSIINKLDKYNELEKLSEIKFAKKYQSIVHNSDPIKSAENCRKLVGLDDISPVNDVVSVVMSLGIKLLSVNINTDKFFSLSVGEEDGGPAIIINDNDKISYEQASFSIIHETGHFFMHNNRHEKLTDDIIWSEEDDADLFASYVLMPENGFKKYWDLSAGLSFADRVIKVKQIFGVHYKTILYRLGDYKKYLKIFESDYDGCMKEGRDPESLQKRLYIDEGLRRIMISALQNDKVSLTDAAHILKTDKIRLKESLKYL